MKYGYSLFAPHIAQPVLLTIPPIESPVTLEEAKVQLKLDTDADDAFIENLIVAVTDFYEKYTKRDFITKGYTSWITGFYPYIQIRKTPNVTITSLNYYDVSNVLQIVDNTVYTLSHSNDFPVLHTDVNQYWPNTVIKNQNVNIEFTVGYGTAADVPALIKQAILLGIATLYENRGDCGDSGGCGDCSRLLNPTAGSLLRAYRITDLNVNTYNVRF